ncbi:MAG: efflux RND transporter periplasmic adaptor subunit [Myxococcota bacterium]
MTSTPQPPPDESEPTRDTATGWKRTVVISVLVLLVAAGVAALTFFTEPTAERGGATKKTAMLVDVVRVARGTHRPLIEATGTVEPAQDVVLRAQVEGRIVERAAEFTPGGFVEQGETLVTIEPDDFEHALARRRGDLAQARADLAVEEGRQHVARDEYAYLDQALPDDREALVLRKPQLEAARGRVRASRAAVDQARLELERATVEAPFPAHILRRDVNVGSLVSPEDPLARLVGLETYWVVVDLPLSKLRWVSIPERAGEEGSEVRVRNRTAWPEGVARAGRLHRLVGALDGRTRMARVLAVVRDPLARRPETEGPALLVGEFVEARIRGNPIEDAARLDRGYVRDEDTVWVMEDGRLRIRDVEIAVRDADHAFITGGLEDGDRVVTTNLSTVTDGARLRLRGADDEEAPAE